MATNGSLITLDEAEEVVKAQEAPLVTHRTILLVIVGALMALLVTILIMLILSLRGATVGVERLIPSTQTRSNDSLQL